MSVVAVRPIGCTHSFNWKFQRQYTQRYQVEFNVTNADPAAVRTAVDPVTAVAIPARLAAYPTDALALVSDIKVTQESTLFFWTVEVSYTSTFEFDPATTAENPLLRPAVVKYYGQAGTKAVRYDLDEEAIDYSNETPVDPPVEMSANLLIIDIQQNLATVVDVDVSNYIDSVNSDTWRGISPGKAKIQDLQIERKQENSYLYWSVHWVIAVRKNEGFRPTKILDQGFGELVDGTYKLFRDSQNVPLAFPCKLDGSGAKLGAGEDPVFLEFNLHNAIVFTGLVP